VPAGTGYYFWYKATQITLLSQGVALSSDFPLLAQVVIFGTKPLK
jgi:hypothetical protein